MREMDPSKHIPFDDSIQDKPDRRVHRPIRIIFFLVVSILYTLGLVFYMDFYYSENESVIWDQNTAIEDVINDTGTEQYESAKILMEEGMAKWDDLEYVEYSAKGSDGDEIAYFDEHYRIDNINDEFWYSSSDNVEICLGDEEGSTCELFTGFVRKDEKTYKYTEGDKQEVEPESFSSIADLTEISAFVLDVLNRDNSGFDIDVNIVDGVYNPDNQPVKFVEINYYRKQTNNALSNIFKVYADVIYDKLSIEMIIDSEGNILEAKVPHVYSEMKLYFYSYNEPLEISLPDEE
jgi:hypothetical protein